MRISVAARLVTLSLLLAAPAPAQTADARWAPWLGCWNLVADTPPPPTPNALRERDAGPGRRRAPESVTRVQVCVEPRDEGVVLRTLAGDRPALEQAIVASGEDRPMNDAGCRGTERATWSRDGRRLFSRATLACPGQPERSVSGFTLLGPAGTWIDIQDVRVGSRQNVRVRHFQRAAGGPAPTAGTRPLSVDDVIEASRMVTPGALEAALIESRARFALSSRMLVAMADAGVPDSVTDLMVAVSYPRAFIVERTGRDDRLASFDPYPYSGGWSYGPTMFWNTFDDSYFLSPYYYSPFGYSFLGLYPQAFGSGVAVGGGGGDAPRPRESGLGRVVDGQGYTRVRPREAVPQEGGSTGGGSTVRGSGGTVTRRGYTSDGGSSSSGSSSGGSTSGSGSSSGSSGGGGSEGGGRTAVPR